ncbi:hypothetical protein ACNI3K_01775 [Demequina sp. SO4-13]|uniref:hypothetical protein n=1 Tax=Demequina sp. SO4-13 TaxID=3401027 RepID=UPI003AF75EBE
MSPDLVASRTRWLVRVAVALLIATLAATGALFYGALGWRQMATACSAEEAVPARATGSSVQFSWSWTPPGFACTWPGTGGDGVTVTKLWW